MLPRIVTLWFELSDEVKRRQDAAQQGQGGGSRARGAGHQGAQASTEREHFRKMRDELHRVNELLRGTVTSGSCPAYM